MFRLILPAMLVLASSPFPAVAQGAQRDAHVAYRDLDLATPAGVTELDRRIKRAIKAMCPADDSAELARKAIVKRCHRVLTAAVAGQRAQAIASAARSGPVVAAR
ncbi:UrcA family protein [Sphingomonas cannabina]|uniref:UrcA family protein n=1 Tax=Sphingomonas cannabina TaxID=2899123 RepID=UPI001F337F2E|nr:UrcA family protein [Sphingomonas cannabina]UIJ47079.1 UrcA family protein [Sphingomonas cannabina]